MYTYYPTQLRTPQFFERSLRRGFTLIEILIVVILLGILAAIVIPSFASSKVEAQDSIAVTNIRYAVRQFTYYRVKYGEYPPDRLPGQMPVGMDELLGGMDWAETTPIGGKWDWDHNVFGVVAGVSFKNPDRTDAEMRAIDRMLDDGNLSSGSFRKRDGGYIYVIED
jgi:prepilin-type N-terminal cleavage/methylation domain-containing protein